MEVLNVVKPTNEETKKEKKDEKPSRWVMLRCLTRCLSFSRKMEQLNEDEWNDQTCSDKSRVACNSEKSKDAISSDKDFAPPPFTSPPSPMNRGNASPALSIMGSEIEFSGHLRQFSFSELKSATRNFKPQSVIGEGGFGRVYKGWVNDLGTTPKPGRGLAVAVKTLNHEGRQGHKEWLAEVNYLDKLHHPNLVKLVGFCIEGNQRLLVYEFMARGSLENHLFRRGVKPLSWSIRIKVALDAAKGLAYLHEETEKPVIYRDFKTSNILLDGEFNAKLSDFGLAKDGPEGDQSHVSTRVMGTFGYAAPEYVRTGHLTAKSDIYSFGIVLLEILSGRKSVDRQRAKGQQNLLDWALPYLRDRKQFLSIMDPSLEHCFPIHGARKAIHLASLCIRHDPKARPSMSEIVKVLTPLSDLKYKPQTSPLPRTKPQSIHSPSPRNSFKLAATPSNSLTPRTPRTPTPSPATRRSPSSAPVPATSRSPSPASVPKATSSSKPSPLPNGKSSLFTSA